MEQQLPSSHLIQIQPIHITRAR